MSATLIIPAPIGQLGNRLTHFSHLRAFAQQRGLVLLHTAFHPYADSFVGTKDSLFCVFDPIGGFCESPQAHRLKEMFGFFLDHSGTSVLNIDLSRVRDMIRKISFAELDREVTPIMRELVFAFGFVLRSWIDSNSFASIPGAYIPGGDAAISLLEFEPLNAALQLDGDPYVLLDGWGFRCAEGLATHRNSILAALTPLPDLEDRAQTLLQAAHQLKKRSEAKIVGLHVRRGDYAQWQDGKFFFEWEEYSSVVKQMQNHLGADNCVFLVCSNEPVPPDVVANAPHVISAETDPVVDMSALGLCDLIVGPPSTFSSWAAGYRGVRLLSIAPGAKVEL